MIKYNERNKIHNSCSLQWKKIVVALKRIFVIVLNIYLQMLTLFFFFFFHFFLWFSLSYLYHIYFFEFESLRSQSQKFQTRWMISTCISISWPLLVNLYYWPILPPDAQKPKTDHTHLSPLYPFTFLSMFFIYIRVVLPAIFHHFQFFIWKSISFSIIQLKSNFQE